jgi:hypothetical protein
MTICLGAQLGTSIGLLVRSNFLRIKGLGTLAQFISLYRQEGKPREQPLKKETEQETEQKQNRVRS